MKFSLNVTFLRYFYSASLTNSISKAAAENFVSQSAISQAITKLELVLGKQLITHEKNRFQLTAEGVLLSDKCKKLFNVFSEIEDSFNETDGIYKGKLTFACSHSFALSLLPPHLGKLSKRWGKVEPILRFGHTGTIVEQVKKGEVDFGIVLDNEDFSSFNSCEIYSGEYHLYCSEFFPLEAPSYIVSEERREVTLLRHHLQKIGLELNPYMEVSSWEVIASLTEQGLGIGFLPDYIVGKRALTQFKCKLPVIPYKILAIYSKNRPLSRNAQMFLDLMCE